MDDRVKKLSRWQTFFLIIGILGLIDIATKSIIGTGDIGGVSLFIGYVIGLIFGSNAGGIIMALVWPVFSFSVVWLGVAWGISTKRKKLLKEVNAPKE